MIGKYKLNLKSCEKIADEIKILLKEIDTSFDKLKNHKKWLSDSFEEIRNVKPKVDALQSKIDSFEEYNPDISNRYHGMKEALDTDISKVENYFKDMTVEGRIVIHNLKKIIFGLNTSLYRESVQLDKFEKQIKKSGADEKLVVELISKINIVKEDMMAAARKMHEVASAEEHDLTSDTSVSFKIKPISKEIGKLGVEIGEVAKILEALSIDDIDEIVQNAEKELEKIKKVQIDCIMLMINLEDCIIPMKENVEILPDKEDMKHRLDFFEAQIEDAKREITKQSEMLLKDIKICVI